MGVDAATVISEIDLDYLATFDEDIRAQIEDARGLRAMAGTAEQLSVPVDGSIRAS